jgi:ubiquitin C
MQIFVRTCNRTIGLNVNLASDSVEEVKRLIEEREGIPVSEQHLIFGGKPLRHGTSLRDYEALGDGSTINVIPRIRGGNR